MVGHRPPPITTRLRHGGMMDVQVTGKMTMEQLKISAPGSVDAQESAIRFHADNPLEIMSIVGYVATFDQTMVLFSAARYDLGLERSTRETLGRAIAKMEGELEKLRAIRDALGG